HRPEIAEVDIKGPERRNDHEIRQDEGPSADPGSPKAAPQIGDIDADLDGERSRQRLTDGDRLAHLFLGRPAAVRNELPPHLAYERDGSPKAKQPQAKKVGRKLSITFAQHNSSPDPCGFKFSSGPQASR